MTDSTCPPRTNKNGYAVAEVLWIVALFFLLGSELAPSINEPHYLSRAKHFWNPDFCQGDYFLESRDAHGVFFVCFGWMTRWFSLPTTAWMSRFLGWALLASAWQRLSFAIVPIRGAGLLSAAIGCMLVQRCHMSGEWLIGGAEGKVVAYGLVLWGLSFYVQGRWNRTWILQGAAAAFHVLVGGWAVLMTLFSAIIERPSERSRLFRSLPGLLAGGVLSAAGLVPALWLNLGVSPDVVDRAAEIYVFDRISHHLLIRDFAPHLIARHVLLIAVFIALWCPLRANRPFARFARVVGGAIALVIVGSVLDASLGNSTMAARLMRYYWFRASDVFVPLGISLAILLHVSRLWESQRRLAYGVVIMATTLATGNMLETVNRLHFQTIPAADRQGGIRSTQQLDAWKDVCYWIRDRLPRSATLLTPTDHQTFKWYARRGEVVTWKDVPQDAESIVQWSQRIARVSYWHDSKTAIESAERFEMLMSRYTFDYAVVRMPASFPLPPKPIVYRNAEYVVLRAHEVGEKGAHAKSQSRKDKDEGTS